jgi:hypothetical protein
MYDPHQPRIPKHHHGGGRWTRDGYGLLSDLGALHPPLRHPWELGGSNGEEAADLYLPGDLDRMRPERGAQYAFLGRDLFRQAIAEAARRSSAALAAGLALFEAWSSRNDRHRQAIATFRAREFVADENGLIILDDVQSPDRETVLKLCKNLEKVEQFLDEVLKQNPPKSGETNQQYGTRIHKELEHKIKKDRENGSGMDAEVSFAVDKPDAPYGTRGSIRVDVIEYLKAGNVCVYDFKTGNAILRPGRMQEIAEMIFKAHKKEPKGPSKIWHITVTQVREGQGRSSQNRQ